ncbi:hypothetical protein J2X97_002803 [Epilithonimonas hungarica]|uniref:hypothetical protein n=1 Tax=Epilithonimonas hungarica TaxID=454006 RepID=UPI00278B0DF9|nr:hypothetical protein [Epilithonimonas hungarica]MDP9957137.1 hypothetical protein [Epilithonimonas hungarica]
MNINFKLWLTMSIMLSICSCSKYDNTDIIKFLNSDDTTQIIKGCSLLNDKKDTVFVRYLFNNIEDTRISHDAQFYGISVFEARIKTLKRISNLNPPNEISYKYDSINANFYKDWAIEKGFIHK